MRILFVCTGNTCRSPMAAAIARQVAQERGLTDLVIASAGTGAYDGASASDGALLVAMERGADLGEHRSHQLSAADVERADLVLVMSPQHLQRVRELSRDANVYLLSDFASHGAAPRTISDPFGGDLDTYRATYEELEHEVRRVFERLTPQSAPPTGGGPAAA